MKAFQLSEVTGDIAKDWERVDQVRAGTQGGTQPAEAFVNILNIFVRVRRRRRLPICQGHDDARCVSSGLSATGRHNISKGRPFCVILMLFGPFEDVENDVSSRTRLDGLIARRYLVRQLQLQCSD